MAAIDYEAEYNNRKRVAASAEIVARWAEASAKARRELPADLDVAYGPGPRHRYDLYHAASGDPGAPLAVYIHGGYWQRGDRSEYAFVSRALTGRGLAVALPSYSLAPEASVARITDEIRQFIAALWQATRRRPVVVGHSAGGHLAAEMLATDWSAAGAVPGDVVRAAYALSGVFEVAPLIPTSLNEALRLTPEAAQAASPLLRPAPPRDRRLVAAVGGQESQEFIRQSLAIAEVWSQAGVKAECVVVPSANHFTIVDQLAYPESAMVARVVEMARSLA